MSFFSPAPELSRASDRVLRLGRWTLMGSLISAVGFGQVGYPASDPDLELAVIAFGSCAREHMPQPVWDEVARHDPDLFLFIGDNVYADSWDHDGDGSVEMMPVTSPARFDEAYGKLAAKPQFAEFRKHVPIMATWDDHDYGDNDAGKEYPLKDVSQNAFWDFFGLAKSSPEYSQAGIYHSRVFGPEERRVQVIVLDTRYFRDALDEDHEAGWSGAYRPTADRSRSLLGETQWAWLEEELRKPAVLRLVVSGIQLVGYEHRGESWNTLPHERQRFFDLVQKTGAEGVMVLSGDRHLTEISVDDGAFGAQVPYPIWDFTSSGMTEPIAEVEIPNKYRTTPVYRGTTFGTLRLVWEQGVDGLDGLTIVCESWKGDNSRIFRHALRGSLLRFPQ